MESPSQLSASSRRALLELQAALSPVTQAEDDFSSTTDSDSEAECPEKPCADFVVYRDAVRGLGPQCAAVVRSLLMEARAVTGACHLCVAELVNSTAQVCNLPMFKIAHRVSIGIGGRYYRVAAAERALQGFEPELTDHFIFCFSFGESNEQQASNDAYCGYFVGQILNID